MSMILFAISKVSNNLNKTFKKLNLQHNSKAKNLSRLCKAIPYRTRQPTGRAISRSTAVRLSSYRNSFSACETHANKFYFPV